ncbi:cytidylate kinase [Dysgonomonadaceae bacterium PH5-43]|nr:cytidylate kinase [Dysgonomonadaceae bacterium PH5-43]
MNNYIITIGRELGSGGKLLGEMLSKELNIPCYDKELIALASKESGLGTEFFEKADEKSSHSIFGSLFGSRSGFIGDSSNNYLSNETLFKIQSDVIKNLAEKSSCIFVGRCADYILRDNKNLLSIFVSANLDNRINTISQNNNISKTEAQTLIEQTDKKRANYYNYFSNKTWGMAASYDLCFNSSKITMERIIEFVKPHLTKT